MKTYNVSGVVNKASGFGWYDFFVSGAKYTGMLTLQGTKSAFDKIVGNLKYEFTLQSVKSWGIDITSLVANKLGGKKTTSGSIMVKGSPMIGSVATAEGYNIFYSADVKTMWGGIIGKVTVTNKATAEMTVNAVMSKDDNLYDIEPVPNPDPGPTPNPDPNPTKDEFARAKMHTTKQEVADWPIISTLTVTNVGNKIRIDVDDATRAKWPRDTSINIHAVLFRDGQWHAGPCDGVRPLPSVKDFKCLCVPEGDDRLFVPDKKLDKKVGVVITAKCRRTLGKDKFRSSLCWIDIP